MRQQIRRSLALEEDWRRTVDGVLSIEANARIYIDQERDKFDRKQWRICMIELNRNRVFVHAHFGTQ